MPVVLVRIDDRLIHGQVVEGWLRAINADYILVVNDDVAEDELSKALYVISVPTEIKVECLKIDQAAKKILNNDYAEKQVLLLVSNPQDALKLIKFGIKFNSINLGGMHYLPGKKQISKALFVDKNDINCLKEIANFGIELECRILPTDEKINITDMIKSLEN